jgi:hypothetical protein
MVRAPPPLCQTENQKKGGELPGWSYVVLVVDCYSKKLSGITAVSSQRVGIGWQH